MVADMHEWGIVAVQSDTRDRRRTIVEISETARMGVQRVSIQDAIPALVMSFPEVASDELNELARALQGVLKSLGTQHGIPNVPLPRS